MLNVLLDYFFKVTTVVPTPPASTAFLRQVLLVVKPKVDVAEVISEVTTEAGLTALTENLNGRDLLNGGLNKIFVLPKATLAISADLNASLNQYFTVIISTDFDAAEIADLDLGTFKGVTCVHEDDETFLEAQAAIENRCAFVHIPGADTRSSACFAFAKMLSNQIGFKNQQYISVPWASGPSYVLADYVDFFDKRISFVISDTQFSHRLGFFVCGGKAIVEPYIRKQIEIDMQSRALSYVSLNQPQYTVVQAALVQDELQKVIDSFIARDQISFGSIVISLVNENFVANANIVISEPTGFWRFNGILTQQN